MLMKSILLGRRLCVQTFSSDWTETRGDFEFDCYSQIAEMSLKQCLDEGECGMNWYTKEYFFQ